MHSFETWSESALREASHPHRSSYEFEAWPRLIFKATGRLLHPMAAMWTGTSSAYCRMKHSGSPELFSKGVVP
jgi:hypothetical protein